MGHLPRKVSRHLWWFLELGGIIQVLGICEIQSTAICEVHCILYGTVFYCMYVNENTNEQNAIFLVEVVNPWRSFFYSLTQGVLEILCYYTFFGKQSKLDKLETVLSKELKSYQEDTEYLKCPSSLKTDHDGHVYFQISSNNSQTKEAIFKFLPRNENMGLHQKIETPGRSPRFGRPKKKQKLSLSAVSSAEIDLTTESAESPAEIAIELTNELVMDCVGTTEGPGSELGDEAIRIRQYELYKY